MNGVSHDMILFSIKNTIHFCRRLLFCSDNSISLYYWYKHNRAHSFVLLLLSIPDNIKNRKREFEISIY
jgi:hypothetical protein